MSLLRLFCFFSVIFCWSVLGCVAPRNSGIRTTDASSLDPSNADVQFQPFFDGNGPSATFVIPDQSKRSRDDRYSVSIALPQASVYEVALKLDLPQKQTISPGLPMDGRVLEAVLFEKNGTPQRLTSAEGDQQSVFRLPKGKNQRGTVNFKTNTSGGNLLLSLLENAQAPDLKGVQVSLEVFQFPEEEGNSSEKPTIDNNNGQWSFEASSAEGQSFSHAKGAYEFPPLTNQLYQVSLGFKASPFGLSQVQSHERCASLGPIELSFAGKKLQSQQRLVGGSDSCGLEANIFVEDGFSGNATIEWQIETSGFNLSSPWSLIVSAVPLSSFDPSAEELSNAPLLLSHPAGAGALKFSSFKGELASLNRASSFFQIPASGSEVKYNLVGSVSLFLAYDNASRQTTSFFGGVTFEALGKTKVKVVDSETQKEVSGFEVPVSMTSLGDYTLLFRGKHDFEVSTGKKYLIQIPELKEWRTKVKGFVLGSLALDESPKPIPSLESFWASDRHSEMRNILESSKGRLSLEQAGISYPRKKADLEILDPNKASLLGAGKPIDYSALNPQAETPNFPAMALLYAFEDVRNMYHRTKSDDFQESKRQNVKRSVGPNQVVPCLGNTVPNWNDLMFHYYCQHGQLRACYTAGVRSGLSREESLKLCREVDPDFRDFADLGAVKTAAGDPLFISGEGEVLFSPSPVSRGKGVDGPRELLHVDVFEYLMFSQAYAFHEETAQTLLNVFYRESPEGGCQRRPKRAGSLMTEEEVCQTTNRRYEFPSPVPTFPHPVTLLNLGR